jgi:hypothetical protein
MTLVFLCRYKSERYMADSEMVSSLHFTMYLMQLTVRNMLDCIANVFI